MSRVFLVGLLLVAIAAGCSSPNAQLSLIQEDKEQLLATIKEQRDTIRSLRAESESKETRLAEAEKALAGGGTRLSSRPDASKAKAEPLPWRSPPGKAAGPPAKTSAANKTPLEVLAAREKRIQIDPQTGAARLDAKIPFDEGKAIITAEGKRQLDDVARLLKTDELKDVRVMIAGYAEGRPAAGSASTAEGEKFATARQLAAARAQAVADYLDRHGVAQERLGVSGLGSRGPLGSDQADRLASAGSVQILLLAPDARVAGWGPTGEAVQR